MLNEYKGTDSNKNKLHFFTILYYNMRPQKGRQQALLASRAVSYFLCTLCVLLDDHCESSLSAAQWTENTLTTQLSATHSALAFSLRPKSL